MGDPRSLRMGDMKTLSLVKGDQYYCFRYEAGQESKVLDALVEMVHKKQTSFDWFDAAILYHPHFPESQVEHLVGGQAAPCNRATPHFAGRCGRTRSLVIATPLVPMNP